jgi:hypothetical protein
VTPPKSVALPSGRVVSLAPRSGLREPRVREPDAPLFSDLVTLVTSGDLALSVRGVPIAATDLPLGDFHALRAIATKLGWLADVPVEIHCRNCGAAIAHAPCAALELGPFVDGELHDPDLDKTLDLAAPHDAGALGELRFRAVTALDAAPLHRALRRRRLSISPDVVRAMGIASIGGERDPARLARRLSRCSDVAWSRLTELFLAAHYAPRLFSIAVCGECGARNDVDAPFEREFELSEKLGTSNAESFPDFDAFDARARAIARDLFVPDDAVVLVVEGGVPACDDGGEPLLGAYVAPLAGDMTMPSRPPEITVYYRTFRAMWDEDGAYDWDEELRETLVHELEHHGYHLGGHDPMDEEEHRVIDEEAVRVIGKRAIVRNQSREVGALAADVGVFFRRTWPIWLLLIVITALVTLGER